MKGIVSTTWLYIYSKLENKKYAFILRKEFNISKRLNFFKKGLLKTGENLGKMTI